MENALYRQHLIWRRDEDRVAVYIVFERLGDGRFGVQSAEFFYPSGEGTDWDRIMRHAGMLMLDDDPSHRGRLHDTIEEAITAHDATFADPLN